MGWLIFAIFFTAVFLLLGVMLWVLCCSDGYGYGFAVAMSFVMIGLLALMWATPFMPATAYTNEENIARYEALIEKVEYVHDNPNSPYIEELYKEVEAWNEEYNNYQSNIGNWFKGCRYPADRYVGCDEIDFWEAIR